MLQLYFVVKAALVQKGFQHLDWSPQHENLQVLVLRKYCTSEFRQFFYNFSKLAAEVGDIFSYTSDIGDCATV